MRETHFQDPTKTYVRSACGVAGSVGRSPDTRDVTCARCWDTHVYRAARRERLHAVIRARLEASPRRL